MKLRPSMPSFTVKYVSALTPLIVYYAVLQIYERLGGYVITAPLLGILVLLGLAWVLRNREATASLALFIVLSAWRVYEWLKEAGVTLSLREITRIPEIAPELIHALPEILWLPALASSVIVLVYTELYRLSISYTLTEDSIIFSGGILKRQHRLLPYDRIGDVILEQTLIGKILGYGTIIPVPTSGWGAEYYTRAVGVGGAKEGLGMGFGYARTLREVSRDPMKVLYGIRKPGRVYEELGRKVAFTYRAEKMKVGLLESIDQKLSETHEKTQ